MDNNDTRWVVAEKNGNAENLANYMKSSPLIGQMILNRGINNIPQAWDFLHPTLRLLHDSALIPNISLAAKRIVRAFRSGDPIAVFGDYDVDGVTATATLYHALKFLGADVRVYVPHRIDEGYGLNPAAMNKLIDEGARLLVSVDCGITGLEAADACMLRGVDLIITDHHEWKAELPAAYCIVHPRLPVPGRPAYPNPDLCGAGVAFKLAWEIGRAFYGSEKVAPEFSELLQELLAFTALGTIADVVPLIGENRAIAHFGLNRLPTSRFPGLDAFIESAHLKGQEVDGYHVGFCLAPRLNAAGRLGHASEALNMLTTYDREAALAIGQELEKQNKRRQETERAIAQEAIAAAEALPQTFSKIVAGKEWHPGVVGIVASRLVERFQRPSLVLVQGEDEVHGSGRSVEGFNLAAALTACDDLLERWGGHAMACGVRLRIENLEAFRQRFDDYVREHATAESLTPKIHIDAVARLANIDFKLCEEIKTMGPFGQGNRRPLLMIEDAVVRDPKTMGTDGKHLLFYATQGAGRFKCIAWNEGDAAHLIPTDTRVDLIVEPQISEWQGRNSMELLVRGIKLK